MQSIGGYVGNVKSARPVYGGWGQPTIYDSLGSTDYLLQPVERTPFYNLKVGSRQIKRKAGRKMILKIFHQSGWVVYDNIIKIRYKVTIVSDSMVGKNNTNVTNIVSMPPDAIWLNNEKQDGDRKIDMFVRFTNDKEMWIVADESIYLCNDEGKTIEKIN